jgi:hypothetical protein
MRLAILVLTTTLLISCSTRDNSNESGPDQVVKDFLTWYRDKGLHLADSMVLNCTGPEWDSTKFYAVNFPVSERYLEAFTRTGMISTKYTDKWRKYFLDADKNFKENPANDGVPDNFDYDFVLCGQDDPGIDELDKTKFEVLQIDEDRSIVLVTFPTTNKYKYYLSLTGGKWLIDDLEILND